MVVSVVGWYGTETMGDKAILDGLLCVFSRLRCITKVQIGSLFPFYTERTLLEERRVIDNTVDDYQVTIFAVKRREERENAILNSDLVVFGGGPLMEIDELRLIRDCFGLAQKKGIKTVVAGAGIGPFYNDWSINIVRDILNLSDVIILRDDYSRIESERVFGSFDTRVYGDPAVISLYEYKKKSNSNVKDRYIVFNVREVYEAGYGIQNRTASKSIYGKILSYLCKMGHRVVLLPMHNFFYGGDDRPVLYGISKGIEGCEVLNDPFDLWDLYELTENAYACLGMRYHSVVIQTILNGNNFIFNYSDNSCGKISGFIKWIDGNEFYSNRMTGVDEIDTLDDKEVYNLLKKEDRFESVDMDVLSKYTSVIGDMIR